jgi:hypothetical protein
MNSLRVLIADDHEVVPLHHVYSLHVLALHEPHTATHHTHGHVVIFRFRSGHHLQDLARSLVESLHRGQNITV